MYAPDEMRARTSEGRLMAVGTTCPRCGSPDSFMKGYLPETCVCRVCMSQLDWREIPGCGPDCHAETAPDAGQPSDGTIGSSAATERDLGE